MAKFLLATLLIAFAVKVMTDSGVLHFQHRKFKPALIDEARKSEKSKQEESSHTSKSASDKEEKYYADDPPEYVLANLTGILPSQTNHHKPHPGFTSRLYTPPNLLYFL